MRFFEFRDITKQQLIEGARIHHAEDFMFWGGSAEASRVINSIENLEKGGHSDVTVKWDGSPAIIFGRDEDGRFILTDKSGFTAKGYDGKATSGEALQKMFMARPGAKNDPEGYKELGGNMAKIFPMFERAVPKDFRGFFKGDLLYFDTPPVQDGKYFFKPQIVTYTVDQNSDIGKRIGQSKAGVVVHRIVYDNGTEGPLPKDFQFEGTDVFFVPPVTVEKAPEIDNTKLNALKALVSKHARAIDTMLNQSSLAQLKMSDFSNILYAYTNSKVDTGMGNMGQDFMQWLDARKQVSGVKKARMVEYINTHKVAFDAMWQIHTQLMQVKDDIINQMDSHDSTVKARIDGHGEGGEGYVLAHPEGDIKLVPREYFTKANRATER